MELDCPLAQDHDLGILEDLRMGCGALQFADGALRLKGGAMLQKARAGDPVEGKNHEHRGDHRRSQGIS